MFIFVGACGRTYTEGIFIYQKLKDGGADIIGLTEEGQELEVVIFPTSLPEADYVNIGDSNDFYKNRHWIRSKNLKIAIIGNVNMISMEAFYGAEKCKKAILMSGTLLEIEQTFAYGDVIVPFELYDDYREAYSDGFRIFLTGHIKNQGFRFITIIQIVLIRIYIGSVMMKKGK